MVKSTQAPGNKAVPSVKPPPGFQCNGGLHPSCEGQHGGQPGPGGKTPSSEEEPDERVRSEVRLQISTLLLLTDVCLCWHVHKVANKSGQRFDLNLV